MITIVDSGGANISSIQFAFERLGVEAKLSREACVIQESTHVILPGVGSAESAMRSLNESALVPVIRSLTQPVLGICLGMQILFDYSEEGRVDCLGLIPGKIQKLDSDNDQLIVPHMGWNTLQVLKGSAILKTVPDHSYAYFVHSYAAPIGSYTLALTQYGMKFSSLIQYRNFIGAQFHPERSSDLGLTILKNFLEL